MMTDKVSSLVPSWPQCTSHSHVKSLTDEMSLVGLRLMRNTGLKRPHKDSKLLFLHPREQLNWGLAEGQMVLFCHTLKMPVPALRREHLLLSTFYHDNPSLVRDEHQGSGLRWSREALSANSEMSQDAGRQLIS